MRVKLKIASRLFLGFGALMVLISLLTGYWLYSGEETKTAFNFVIRFKTNEALDQQAEKQLFQTRFLVWKYLATGEEANFQAAQQVIQEGLDTLDRLIGNTIAPDRLEKAKKLKQLFVQYTGTAEKFHQFRGRNEALESPAARETIAEGNRISAEMEALSDSLLAGYSQAAAGAVQGTVDRIKGATDAALAVGCLSILLGSILSFLISRSIIKPVGAITEAIERLAQGRLDFEVPGQADHDEIGIMARSSEQLRLSLVKAREAEAALTRQKEEAAALRRQEMLRLADSFEDAIGSVATVLSDNAGRMQSLVASLSAMVEQTSRQSEAVAEASEQVSGNVQTAATAAEELTASIGEIGRQMDRSTKVVQAASQDAENADIIMKSLSEMSSRIGEVVGLISSIAGQTNLLALNATIEAARAGESGKGFAVVANEVKTLATQTARATEEIGQQVHAVQNAADQAVQAISGIVGRIGDINEIASAIAASVEEQAAATSEIARNVLQAAHGAQEVSANIGGVADATKGSGAGAQEVLSSTRRLTEEAEKLKTQVKSFLAEVRAS